MRIKRVLDGKEYEIELTLPEMNSAYFERRNAFDHEDVSSNYNYMTVGASVQLTAKGISATGDAAEIPEGA